MITTIANHITFRTDTRAEKNLWVAVLEQAINDSETLAFKVQDNPNLWDDPLFRADARELISYFQNRSTEMGSFGFICDLMDMDPGQAAKSIHEKYLRHLTPVTEGPTRMDSLAAA